MLAQSLALALGLGAAVQLELRVARRRRYHNHRGLRRHSIPLGEGARLRVNLVAAKVAALPGEHFGILALRWALLTVLVWPAFAALSTPAINNRNALLWALAHAALVAAVGMTVRHAAHASGFVPLAMGAGMAAGALVVAALTKHSTVLGPTDLSYATRAGYLAGSALVFGTALAVESDVAQRVLFERRSTRQLVHRGENPLLAPFPAASRSQLRCCGISAVVAAALAAAPGHSLPAVTMLLLATGWQVAGWRAKQLSAAGAACAALLALPLALGIWLSFGGHFEAAALQRELSILQSHGPAQWLIGNGFSARAPIVVACLVALLATRALLAYPPAGAALVVGHAPGWAWMLVGALAAALPTAVFPEGALPAAALALTVSLAFVIVWIDRLVHSC